MQKNYFKHFPFTILLLKNLRLKIINHKIITRASILQESNVVKSSDAFTGYERSYKVEIVDHKDPLVQLQASKSSIEDLFKDLSDEMKVFKYQITVAVLLSKVNINGSIEYSLVYFNSTTKTVINSEFNLDKLFQGIL